MTTAVFLDARRHLQLSFCFACVLGKMRWREKIEMQLHKNLKLLNFLDQSSQKQKGFCGRAHCSRSIYQSKGFYQNPGEKQYGIEEHFEIVKYWQRRKEPFWKRKKRWFLLPFGNFLTNLSNCSCCWFSSKFMIEARMTHYLNMNFS